MLINSGKKHKGFSLKVAICNALSWKEYSPKTSNGILKHVTFRLSSDSTTVTKRTILFPYFKCQFSYILGGDPFNSLLNYIAVSILDEEQEEQGITTLCSDQLSDIYLYEADAKMFDDE